jgi:glycosyltransferase involved in cell wall biosynthesis
MLDGIHVIRASNISTRLRGRLNLSTPNKMTKLALELLPGVDLVHCHEFRTVENLMVTPWAFRQGKPLVLSPHGTLALNTGRGRLKTLWDRTLSSAVALRFDHIVGLTETEIAEAQALWPSFGRRRIPAGFSVIPNGVDPAAYLNLPGREAFRAKYNLGDAPVCLFMARLHPRKGVDSLVQAFRLADVPGSHLVIAGPDEGMLDHLHPLLDERMVVTGYLDGQERLAAFAAADLFALPAVGEGLPMVVLEAMAAGLPVIVSPGCNLPEVVEYGAGLEVEPAVPSLAEALRTLLLDAPRRAEMAAAGQKLVAERFTWDAVAEGLETLYQKLLDEKSPTSVKAEPD